MKYNYDNETNEHKVEEAVPKYFFKQQGEYTIEDYYALPQEVRAELIDGVIYDMTAPRIIHQKILLDIAIQLRTQINAQNGKCQVYIAPVDVKLDCDNKTMVQPDIIILCDLDKEEEWGINGAPDFVLEVLSPSTRKKDLTIKHRKYLNAGVREYWIIDPEEKRLITYDFEKGENVAAYPLVEKVGLSIYNKEIIIDLAELAEIIES